jgi:hypothetical protein
MYSKIDRILEKIKILNIELEPTIDLNIIKDYENQFNIKLPETYVLYLTRIQNGGYGDLYKGVEGISSYGKGPYYGIYAFEKSIEENNEWGVDINEEFKLIEDFEIVEDERVYDESGCQIISEKTIKILNGTIPICTYGCGDSFRLIINGKKSGEIFVDDGTINSGGYYFMNVDILTFYENWLDRKIKNNDELINAYYSFLEFGKNNKFKIMGYASTSHNTRYTLRRLRRLGLRKTAVGLAPLVRFFSATFCGCWSLLRKALIRNRKTSYTFAR